MLRSVLSRQFITATHKALIQSGARSMTTSRKFPYPKATPLVDPSVYDEVYQRSLEHPSEFWAEQAHALVWEKKWDKVIDNSNEPFTKWFVGGKMNTCYNCVDRHIDHGFGDQVAIIHDSPVTGAIKKITFDELKDQVSHLAGVLVRHGVKKGDRVLIYMPMIAEAVIAMLACVRIGALHSLVFGGFASKELAARIDHAEPRVIISANCGIEPSRVVQYKPLLDAAIEQSYHQPESCIIYNRTNTDVFKEATMIKGRDYCWREEMAQSKPHDCVPIDACDPSYILYTSGTTGLPKAVVRPNAGHAVVLNWSMYNIYGVNPHETWFAASDLGWIVGHSYIVYAPLLHCNTTIVYEGKPVGTPDPSAYYRIIHDHKVVAMFVAPTALRALRREDPEGDYAGTYTMPDFRYMFVAGEHCDHETMEWIQDRFKTPVLDNWWQTETGSAITSTCVGLGTDLYPPPGVAGPPAPGWDIRVINRQGEECAPGELGRILAKLPLPPACFSTLYNNDERFKDLYFTKFPGYYDTADAGFRDRHGNIAVMARSDDVINVAGHRLSTGQLEEAILEHPDVAEAAVVGIPNKLKGQVPLGLCVLKHGIDKPYETFLKEIIETVREHVGPVASFKDAIVVQKLPKTRSGKIARNTITAMLAGKPYKIPVTIEDPKVYPMLEQAFIAAGYHPNHPQY